MDDDQKRMTFKSAKKVQKPILIASADTLLLGCRGCTLAVLSFDCQVIHYQFWVERIDLNSGLLVQAEH